MSKIILLDNIRSMQNVWAIFRNADWAWFDKVVLTGYTPYPPRNEIAKTALGWEKFVDWEYYNRIEEALEKVKSEWYEIWSVELDERSLDYKDLINQSENKKVCLVMWNEVSGVNKKILDISEKIVIIPMKWKKESLNVSVAAWIVMFAI